MTKLEHTEKYLQAKWVAENPKGYDERDVIDAKRYCNAYLEGYNQALSVANVAGELTIPDVSSSCEWCGAKKENHNGLCTECGRFPSPSNFRSYWIK